MLRVEPLSTRICIVINAMLDSKQEFDALKVVPPIMITTSSYLVFKMIRRQIVVVSWYEICNYYDCTDHITNFTKIK